MEDRGQSMDCGVIVNIQDGPHSGDFPGPQSAARQTVLQVGGQKMEKFHTF